MPVEHYFGLPRVARTMTVFVTAMTVAAMVNTACLLSARRPGLVATQAVAFGTPWLVPYVSFVQNPLCYRFFAQRHNAVPCPISVHRVAACALQGLTLITRLTVLYGPAACIVTAVLVVTV
jgi:hypothetical protein